MTTHKSVDSTNSLAGQSPMITRAADQAAAVAQRGVDAVREGSQQVRDRAQQASESTVKYIKEEPIKSVLIAAATGAALMALISLASRSRDRS
jgi:ElaB/YqjD/DUF883 family membrane-anchored ribosome-binding protein